jgi:hypothetical protein
MAFTFKLGKCYKVKLSSGVIVVFRFIGSSETGSSIIEIPPGSKILSSFEELVKNG